MFHKNLKAIRLTIGLSQKQVADYLNISPQSVSKWEKGDALPSIEFLPKLAKCLNCNVNDFFIEESVPPFEYCFIYRFFALEIDIMHSEIENEEEMVDFIKEYPNCFEMATELCKTIKAYKILRRKNIQGILSCSEEEANDFIILLQRHEIIEKVDIDDTYFVHKDALNGLIILMRVQKQLYRCS